MILKALRPYEKRLRLFKDEAQEPWKQDHDLAMKCIQFEGMLRMGIDVYDNLIALDEKLRGQFLSGERAYDTKLEHGIRKLFELWLMPCNRVEADLQRLEQKGFAIPDASEFRKRHQEAIWMLKPARKAFADPKIVGCRDNAIEALRADDVVTG